MDHPLFLSDPEQTLSVALPTLPEPTRLRWQPLRVGLVELFHYDSEEFWFRDGHLLLRGNNGTGKSKVLSLTLPFLFDAQLKSSRIEPDGDAGKKMAWNLLLGKHERRIRRTKAIDHALKRWPALQRYASSGTLPIDNNPVENAIRPIAIGKNNANGSLMRTRLRRREIPPLEEPPTASRLLRIITATAGTASTPWAGGSVLA